MDVPAIHDLANLLAGAVLAAAVGAIMNMRDAAHAARRRVIRLTPPDPVRSAAGRKGAAVTNARRAAARAKQRAKVLAVAAEINAAVAAKKQEPKNHDTD